jgi:hypothetical protein
LLILLLVLDTAGGVDLPFFGIYLPKLAVGLATNKDICIYGAQRLLKLYISATGYPAAVFARISFVI